MALKANQEEEKRLMDSVEEFQKVIKFVLMVIQLFNGNCLRHLAMREPIYEMAFKRLRSSLSEQR